MWTFDHYTIEDNTLILWFTKEGEAQPRREFVQDPPDLTAAGIAAAVAPKLAALNRLAVAKAEAPSLDDVKTALDALLHPVVPENKVRLDAAAALKRLTDAGLADDPDAKALADALAQAPVTAVDLVPNIATLTDAVASAAAAKVGPVPLPPVPAPLTP